LFSSYLHIIHLQGQQAQTLKYIMNQIPFHHVQTIILQQPSNRCPALLLCFISASTFHKITACEASLPLCSSQFLYFSTLYALDWIILCCEVVSWIVGCFAAHPQPLLTKCQRQNSSMIAKKFFLEAVTPGWEPLLKFFLSTVTQSQLCINMQGLMCFILSLYILLWDTLHFCTLLCVSVHTLISPSFLLFQLS
jgi:hypothetical protein